MKSKEDIAEIIFDAFRKNKSRAGHIIMMRVFHHSILPNLNPKEQDIFPDVVNDLIGRGLILYEKSSPECLKLTEKGFEHIYAYKETSDNTKNVEENKSGTTMINPLKILEQAIEKVPFVKYALGIAGIASAIAIIRTFNIENYRSIPVISILVMLGFMVLLFLFSSLTKVKDKPLKFAGYILVYTTVAITCISSVLLATSVFFDKPKPITAYGIFPKDKVDTSKIITPVDTMKIETKKQEKKPIIPSKTPITTVQHKSCFPYANQDDLSATQSAHDAAYFTQFSKTPVEKIFWKAKITREFNDELDCVYAASQDIALRLNMLNGNDIKCAKELKVGMQVFIWGTTKEDRRSPMYLDINIETLKIYQ